MFKASFWPWHQTQHVLMQGKVVPQEHVHDPWEIHEAILTTCTLIKTEISSLKYCARIVHTYSCKTWQVLSHIEILGRKVNDWKKEKKTEKGKYFSWHNNKIFNCRPEPSIGLNFKQTTLPAEYWPSGKWQPLCSLIYTQMKRFWVPDTRKPVLLTPPPHNL